ncbi:pirin family protein [Streptomyces sp. TRM 70351]|uniref:pirin family protein n=1 Tax=Streptomyces sp. TRM 70351 TaxID=3116552 RepID=UPI002E7B4E49|nr:pirin family protein [Streptomyces sp. TRM 70351]MEE1928515.1 pirin family protein [Streptomyces sp. TRM 70351]
MLQVRRAAQRYRGGDPAAGVDTRHSFSFSGFYDPRNTGFGLLVACNEETLAPGAGFAEHPHRDLHIVTWVVDGELTHTDTAGHATVVRPGDLQRLSAGGGVRHTERNAGREPLRFWQMWLVPGTFGGVPRYEVVRGIPDTAPYALDGTRAVLHVRRLAPGGRTALPDAPWSHVQVVRGGVRLTGETPAGPDGVRPGRAWLEAGDAARASGARGLTATAGPQGAECLVWEMHAEPSYG